MTYENPGTSFTLSDSPTSYAYGSSNNPAAIRSKTGGAQADGGSSGSDGSNPIPTGRVMANATYVVSTWTPEVTLSNLTLDDDGGWNIQVGTPTTAVLTWTNNLGVQFGLPHELSVTS